MKKLLLMAVALLGSFAAQAQTTIGNEGAVLKGKAGNMTINLASVSGARDMQFSVLVPTGITLGSVDGGCVADATEMYDGVAISDGEAVTGGTKYTVVIYSTEAETNDGGKILTLPVTVTNDYAGGFWNNTTVATISDAKYTDDDADEFAASAGTYAFEIGLLGDVDKSGAMDISDVVALAGFVGGKSPEEYKSALAADYDESGAVDISDVVELAIAVK